MGQKSLMRKETKRFEKKQKEIATKEKIQKRPSLISESIMASVEELDFEGAQSSRLVEKRMNGTLLEVKQAKAKEW